MTESWARHFVGLGAIAVGLLIYYGYLASRFDSMVVRQVVKLKCARYYSLAELSSVVDVGVAGVLQLVVCLFLALLVSFDGTAILGQQFSWACLGLGLALGLGEMAVASFACFVLFSCYSLAQCRRVPYALRANELYLRTQLGWVKSFGLIREVLPWPLAQALILFYVAIEEIIFRGLLLGELLQVLPPSWAIGAATAVFAACQLFGMPRNVYSLAPVISAVIMGTVHGAAYVAIQSIAPLILAHWVFLAATVNDAVSIPTANIDGRL